MKHAALVIFFAIAPAAGARSLRSDVRDQAHAQRHTAAYCQTCERTSSGPIRRSPAARRAFQRQQPCPATGSTTGACPGYVVDHVIPLKRGGPDDPTNMQWQTVEEARAKDRWE